MCLEKKNSPNGDQIYGFTLCKHLTPLSLISYMNHQTGLEGNQPLPHFLAELCVFFLITFGGDVFESTKILPLPLIDDPGTSNIYIQNSLHLL